MVDAREFGNGNQPHPVLAPSLGRFRLFGTRPRTSVRMSAVASPAIADVEPVKLKPETVECTGADDIVIDEVVPILDKETYYELEHNVSEKESTEYEGYVPGIEYETLYQE